MTRRILTCLIALTILLSSTGPMWAAHPLQPSAVGLAKVVSAQVAAGALDADIVAVLASATQVAVGGSHTCALTDAGGVKCWGRNGNGELGDGTIGNNRMTPVDVNGLMNGARAITAGWRHTCALTTVGGVKCWGANYYGQLGDGTTASRTAPVEVSGLTGGVMAIAAAGQNTCALMMDGRVKCWGANSFGNLGDGTTTTRTSPVDVVGLNGDVVAITAGGPHTCALTSGGGVKCWGYNYYGELGDGTRMSRTTPIDVAGLAVGVVAIAAGNSHTCAVTTAGGVKCWGRNSSGQLGDGVNTDRNAPVDVIGLSDGVTTALVTGANHTCGLTGGGVRCWGNNGTGQLGDGTNTQRNTPVDVVGLTDRMTALAAGADSDHACAVMTAGSVKCWGSNGAGELGDGTTTSRNTPVGVVGFEGAVVYTLFGRVTDGGGNAIADATVSVGAGGSLTTDGNGTYTISGLAAGTYTLMPSKTGYTFSPAARTVTVPPDATGQDFTGVVTVQGSLTLRPLYPTTADQPSRILRGGVAHRYFEVRDAAGARAPFVTVVFAPTGSGMSNNNGVLDVAVNAVALSIQASHNLTAVSAGRWGQNYTFAAPVSFVVEVNERPFQHHWYGGTVRKAKGGVSVGLVAFLEGQVKGGLGWELEETDATLTSDDRLRLAEQFQAEIGGGAGLGVKLPLPKVGIVSTEAGATATMELKGLAQGESQSRFDAPYTEPQQKAQAVFVLSGLLDMVPEVPGAPALAATIRALGPSVNYVSYQEKMVTGVGAEWTPTHLHASAEIELAGIGGEGSVAVSGSKTPAPAHDPGSAASLQVSDLSLGPLLKLDALDAEKTLRLFGTYSEDYATNESSLALEQEVGFDLDLLTVQTIVQQKLGVYVGERSSKLKEELFFSQATGRPVRFELSLTGEGNATTFSDVALREVTTKFIVEGADLNLALPRVRNLTALLAAWDALPSQGVIAGNSAAYQELQSYLTSVPWSRYEVAAATEGTLEIVPEIGWSGILDIELGAGAEFKQGREIVVERGYATSTGLLATEVYPDHQYGTQSGKTIWDLLGNALTGARLIVEGLFGQVVQSVEQGVAWTVEILGRTVEGIVRGGAQLSGGGGTMYRAPALDGGLLAPSEAFTITASAWAPATGSGTSRSRLLSASGEGFAVGGVYQFSPYTMTLTPPATLAITYTVEAVGTADPNLLDLYRWRPEEANWQPLSATHDMPGRAMTATIGQLGTYVIGYDGTQPGITMLQPTAVVTQTHLPQFSAVITDTGSGIAPASVHLLVGGQPVAASYAALSGQLWYTGTVFLPNGPYTYTVIAADTAGNLAAYEGSFTVNVPAPAVLGADPPAMPHGVAATVTIIGQDFSYPPVVQIDGVTMINVGYLGLTAISVTLPANLALGPHSVSIAAPDGQSNSKAVAVMVVDPSALKPLAPTLAVAQSLASMKLTWLHRTQSISGYPASVTYYEVWGSATPYFSPTATGTNLIAQVTPPSWSADGEQLSYSDDSVEPSEASRFYRVRSTSLYGYISDASNPVGVFNFALVPGMTP